MDSATSLNAEVGPRNSSSTRKGPTLTLGVMSSVSNFPVYARFTRVDMWGMSGSKADKILAAISWLLPARQAFQSKEGMASGIYRPPSAASPSKTAWALSAARDSLRVE